MTSCTMSAIFISKGRTSAGTVGYPKLIFSGLIIPLLINRFRSA